MTPHSSKESVKMAAKPNGMKGGFWNSPTAEFSQQTHSLLKEMMNESKLTNFQQRHLEKSIRGGTSLPTECAPTSSARPRIQKQPKKLSKVLNPKNYTGGVRSKDTMEALGAFEKPEYSLPRYNNRSAREKEKLANIMTYGKDVDNLPKAKVKPIPEPVDVEIDRFEELKLEVEERRMFLDDMIKLGKGQQYRAVMETEISQLVREMEIIDRKRTKELDNIIRSRQVDQSS